jgi:energy-coupling factor transport system ATP-binding protein
MRLDPLPLTVEEAAANHRDRLAKLTIRPQPADLTPGDPIIEVEGLTVRFGDFEALRDVSLAVREGEIVALVGANGSGKSTLLRAIAGTVRPASGRIRLRGQERATVAERTAVAGLVPQDPAMVLYHPSVAEEIASTLTARRGRTDVDTVLDRWGLTALASRDPRDVSVGQQERVAIAAMLAHDPPAWMLDEPTRGADYAARSHLVEMLASHARRGGAAIVATHDIETAARFATRVVKLEAGEIAWDLPVADALGSHGPWPTQIARLVPGALTLEDIVECAP